MGATALVKTLFLTENYLIARFSLLSLDSVLLSAKKIAVMALVFATMAMVLIMVGFRPSGPSPIKTTISEILANPPSWENKMVQVEGIIDGVVTIPEIKLPFNYWLIDKTSEADRIGVLWKEKETLRVGETALVTGIVKSNYEKKLTSEGWVNSTLVYYIEAQAVG